MIIDIFDICMIMDIFHRRSNVDFIGKNLEAVSLPDKKLVAWLLRGYWKESTFSVFKIALSDWKLVLVLIFHKAITT